MRLYLPISIPTSNLNCEHRATIYAKNRVIYCRSSDTNNTDHFSGIVIAPWRQRRLQPSVPRMRRRRLLRVVLFTHRAAPSSETSGCKMTFTVCGTACTRRVARARRSWSVKYLRVRRALSRSTLMPASATDSAASRYATRYTRLVRNFAIQIRVGNDTPIRYTTRYAAYGCTPYAWEEMRPRDMHFEIRIRVEGRFDTAMVIDDVTMP